MRDILARCALGLARTYIRHGPARTLRRAAWHRAAMPLLRRGSWTLEAETSFGARMRLSPPDTVQTYIYMFGVWEPAISAWLAGILRPGDTAIDVGRDSGDAFPVLLVLSDVNWRPLDDFSRLAPDGDPAYAHDTEGPDDMAAHARSVLTVLGVIRSSRSVRTGSNCTMAAAPTMTPSATRTPIGTRERSLAPLTAHRPAAPAKIATTARDQ